MAAGTTGDPESDASAGHGDTAARSERSRVRLHAILVVVLLVCGAAAWVAAGHMADRHRAAGGDLSGGFVDDTLDVVLFRERGLSAETRAGEDVGPGTVQALGTASEEEQERAAAQVAAATEVTSTFLNISHDNADAALETVRSLATGSFRRQIDEVAGDTARLAERARATQRTEILWTGLVSGDDDSARVILAASGTVANRATGFEPRARTYRIRADLALVDDQWLVNDLRYVE